MTQDLNGNTIDLSFDLTDDLSPLIIGLDVQRYSQRSFLQPRPQISLKRPHDDVAKQLPIYINEYNPILARAHIDVIGIIPISNSFLVANHMQDMRPTTLAKRIHRYSHAPLREMVDIMKAGGKGGESVEKLCKEIVDSCPVCAKSGLPLSSKKVSLSHVCQSFNQEVQADFMFVEIRKSRYCVLHIVDAGTRYSECIIVGKRCGEEMVIAMETGWLLRHGAPRRFSADSEFSKGPMRKFLGTHNITLAERPVRRHNKTGIIERKHRTVKNILERLQNDISNASDATLLARATFFSNIFHGSSVISAFELVRGYKPSILGSKRCLVSEELIEAYKDREYARVLQRMLKSRSPATVTPDILPTGTPIYYFYRSSKHTEPVEWKEGKVVEAKSHFVRILTDKDRKTCIAYEDIRVRPRLRVTYDLMGDCVEDYIAHDVVGSRHSDPDSAPTAQDIMTSVPALITTNSHSLSDTAVRADDDEPPILRTDKDIGTHADSILVRGDISGKTLKSEKQALLQQIEKQIGSKQVTAAALQFAPDWVMLDAIESELSENWKDAYLEVNANNLSKDANVIGSHFVFKVKADIDGSLKLKARLVLHGNRDRDRFTVRRDSSSADLSVVRLLLSLSVMLRLEIATADVKGAYMQSGRIQRDIYVRPPRSHSNRHAPLWKLRRLPYGIVEAGRQWLCAVENWLLREYRVSRVSSMEQLFYKRGESGSVELLIAKVVDDFLVAGQPSVVEKFLKALGTRFILGHVKKSRDLTFLGCKILRNGNDSIELSMHDYFRRIKTLCIPKARRKMYTEACDAAETQAFRSLAGTLLYLGQAVLPQACLVASKMQQRIGSLHVSDMLDANQMVKELLSLQPSLLFLSSVEDFHATLITLSDASHAGLHEVYGQTGLISGIKVQCFKGNYFHPITWTSHKQKKVSYSSYGSEILAAADADDIGFFLKGVFNELFPKTALRHELMVDSKSLFETITTLHKPEDYRLRKVVARMRDSFESSELDSIRWIPGPRNYADVLTKRNVALSRKLNNVLNSGIWLLDLTQSCSLDADTWK